jgi:hypothetical protein
MATRVRWRLAGTRQVSPTLGVAPAESAVVAPPSTAQWSWLGGPVQFRVPAGDPDALALALASVGRASLSYRDWRCVLQWSDRQSRPAGESSSRTRRRYELSFWVRGRPVRPGDALGPPGPPDRFVEWVLLSRNGFSVDDESRMQNAIRTLLERAAAAIDVAG